MSTSILMRCRLFGFFLAIAILILGCVKQGMNRQDFEAVKSPMILAWQTPDLRAPTWASAILITLGGVVTGPVGAYVERQSTEKMREIMIPDIGFEVASSYMRIWREKGNPPEMVLAQYPIARGDQKMPSASIDFRFPQYFIGADGGLVANCTIAIKDNSGRTIHKNVKMYTPYALNRKKLSRDDFMADQGKMLAEEIKIAAQYIANEFVKDILGDISK